MIIKFDVCLQGFCLLCILLISVRLLSCNIRKCVLFLQQKKIGIAFALIDC